MSAQSNKAHDLRAKIVIVGLAGSGKLQILSDWSARLSNGKVVGETLGEIKIHRADFSWPDIPAEGGVFDLTVYTMSGELEYSALNELLLTGVDGIVFVVPVEPSRVGKVLESLADLGVMVSQKGRDLKSMPFVLHYHMAEKMPGFNPQDLDDYLGISSEVIPRVVTESVGSPDLTGSLMPLLRRLLEDARVGEAKIH